MNGGTMLVHMHEIVPPLPLEIDDEHLSNSIPHSAHPTTDGNKHTYIAGFVALIKIFVILGECQQRHRTMLNDPEAGQDLPTLMRWLDSAVDRLRRITDGFASDLPLRKSRSLPNAAGGAVGGTDSDVEATAGIQQANICITALCAEFALVRWRMGGFGKANRSSTFGWLYGRKKTCGRSAKRLQRQHLPRYLGKSGHSVKLTTVSRSNTSRRMAKQW